MRGIRQIVEGANANGARAFSGNQTMDTSSEPEEITVCCYENEVPAFIEAELDQLYGHLNSSLSHYVIRREAQGASAYVARRGSQPIAIFLFKREQRKVCVINRMIRIADEEISRFADYIFSSSDSVSVISFTLIRKEMRSLPYPSQQFNFSEDIVLDLPPTPEAYLARLGKNMRRNIKRYTDTLVRDFPSYRYEAFETQDIREQDVRDIIDLNRTRISGKNIVFGIEQEEIEWIVELVRKCGLVGTATIDGRICGGAIAFRIGENYFMHIIGHEPKFNDYSLGILCYYLTIREGIIRGGKAFHFSWGRYEYKYRLLGVQRDMTCLDVYRSHKPFILNAPEVIKYAGKSFIQRKKMQLLDMERRNDVTARFVSRAIKILRRVKRRRSAA